MPGAFDVQIDHNGTLFAQGTEIEAMQRGNLEVALTSPADIAELIPEYSIFTTGYLIRDPAHLDAIYDGDIGKELKEKVATDLSLQILPQPVSWHAPRHPACAPHRECASRHGRLEAAHAGIESLAVPR